MNLKLVIATVVALGLVAAGWFYRHSPPIAGAMRALGLPGENSASDTGTALRAAGVHKCLGAAGTSYIDGACPRGTREVAANGGTMTVTAFPKPAPKAASAVLGGAIMQGMDPEERDRLRDKAIEDAANRK